MIDLNVSTLQLIGQGKSVLVLCVGVVCVYFKPKNLKFFKNPELDPDPPNNSRKKLITY